MANNNSRNMINSTLNNIKKNNKTIMYHLFLFMIILLVLIIFFLFIAKFINMYSSDNTTETKEYQILPPQNGNIDNMNNCMEGCHRGKCTGEKDMNKNSNSCKSDYQCQYCKDPKTNMFYVSSLSHHS
jgi:cell division protein FtsL